MDRYIPFNDPDTYIPGIIDLDRFYFNCNFHSLSWSEAIPTDLS